jgi:type VI secretion system secreted protein VgrG
MTTIVANDAAFTFTVESTEFLVAGFKARERISTQFEANLSLALEEEVQFEEVIGKAGLLTIRGEDEDRYMHGIVNRFVQTGMTGRFFNYEARLVPQTWILGLEQDCRIFQDKDITQIIGQIFEESGITADTYAFRLQEMPAAREYCVQYRETDLDFVSRLLEEEGIFYFFEHEQENHRMVFGDSSVCYQPIAGTANVVMNPEASMVSEEEVVYRFSLSRILCTGKYSLRDYDFAKPALDLSADKSDKENKAYEIYDYPGNYKTGPDGKRLAQVRLEASVTMKDKAEGDSFCPRFLPGFTFNLTGHEMSGLNKAYLLYAVEHSGSQPQVFQERAKEEQGPRYTNLFYAVPARISFRPDRATPRPVVEGVQTAIVTGPSGEEIYTDKHGRVKVQFHWDRLGKKDDKSSCWIRVSQLWAGAGWGAVYLPRIGQEVIVDFVEGDPDRPIIIGRVYHGTNTPPYPLPDQKSKSVIKSNSYKGGGGSNEIRFEDKKDAEEIFIHAQKDMVESVEQNMSTSVGGNRSISVSGTHTESITKDTKVTIGEGNYNHDVKTGAATCHVKGAVKQDYDATLKTTVANDIDVTSKSGHVYITGSTEIHLKVGASELQMKSDGSIKLKGVDIAIDGTTVTVHGGTVTTSADTVNSANGATVLVEGKATAIIKGGMVMLNP